MRINEIRTRHSLFSVNQINEIVDIIKNNCTASMNYFIDTYSALFYRGINTSKLKDPAFIISKNRTNRRPLHSTPTEIEKANEFLNKATNGKFTKHNATSASSSQASSYGNLMMLFPFDGSGRYVRRYKNRKYRNGKNKNKRR